MKKTIYLSLVAGAMIFAGCGGGGGGSSTSGGSTSGGSTSGGSTSGGSTSGGSTSGGSTSGGSTSGGSTEFDYTQHKFSYTGRFEGELPASTITINNNKWVPDQTVAPDLGVKSSVEYAYANAVKYCTDHNGTMPSANDLLTFDKAAYGLTAAWTEGQFVVYPDEGMIGQDFATQKYYVQCLKKNSPTIEKKHTTQDSPGTNTVKDLTTGLEWSYFQEANATTHQFTFPISNPASGQLTAAQFCSNLGMNLPTLAQLRSAVFLDGTTFVKHESSVNAPTVIWTADTAANGNYVVNLVNNATHGVEDGNAQGKGPEQSNAYHFVTCVK